MLIAVNYAVQQLLVFFLIQVVKVLDFITTVCKTQ